MTNEKEFILIDDNNIIVKESVIVSKQFTTEGVLSKKKEYEQALKILDDVILKMKEAGCKFKEEKE